MEGTENQVQLASMQTNCIRKESIKPKGEKETNLGEQILEEEEVNNLTLNPMEHDQSGMNRNLQGVPIEYHDFADVFDLNEARIMPKDRGIWNFKIDFIDGCKDKLPRGAKLYLLTKEEQILKEEMIME